MFTAGWKRRRENAFMVGERLQELANIRLVLFQYINQSIAIQDFKNFIQIAWGLVINFPCYSSLPNHSETLVFLLQPLLDNIPNIF